MCVFNFFYVFVFVCVMRKNNSSICNTFIYHSGVIIGVLMEEEVPLGLEIIAKAIEQNSK